MGDTTKEFICRRCGHVATTKQNLIKHLNKKDKCDIQEGLENISNEDHIKALLKQVKEDAVACRFCGSLFNQKRYIIPHLHVCKNNPQSPSFIGHKPDKDKTDKQIIADLETKLKCAQKIIADKIKENKDLTTKLNSIEQNTFNNIKPIQLIIQINKQPIAKKKIPCRLRTVVWNKYIGENIGKSLCMCCKDNFISCFKFHCGHVIAESNGGETTLENLRPICDDCNQSMQSMNMKEFAYKYFKNEVI
jgi:5-methylcytosine-specific restriction endonuclease McrA